MMDSEGGRGFFYRHIPWSIVTCSNYFTLMTRIVMKISFRLNSVIWSWEPNCTCKIFIDGLIYEVIQPCDRLSPTSRRYRRVRFKHRQKKEMLLDSTVSYPWTLWTWNVCNMLSYAFATYSMYPWDTTDIPYPPIYKTRLIIVNLYEEYHRNFDNQYCILLVLKSSIHWKYNWIFPLLSMV